MSKDKYTIEADRWLSNEQIHELLPNALAGLPRVNVWSCSGIEEIHGGIIGYGTLNRIGEHNNENPSIAVLPGRSVVAVSEVLAATIEDINYNSVNTGISSPTKYIIPVNVPPKGKESKQGNHWTLAIIQQNENGVVQDGIYKPGIDVTYIDPLSRQESNASARIARRQLSERFNVTNFNNLSRGQQSDGWACGYITMQNAVSLAADPTGNSLQRRYNAADTEILYNNAGATLRRLGGQEQGNPQEEPAPEVKKAQQAGQIPQAPKKVRFKEPVEQIPQDLSQSIVDPVNISSKDSPNPQEAETPQSSQSGTQEPKKRKKTASELREEIKVLGEGVKSLSELQYTVPVREFVDIATDILYSGANKPEGKQEGIIGRLDNVIQDFNVQDGGAILFSLFSVVANTLGLLKDIAETTASNVTEYVDFNKKIQEDINSLQQSQNNLRKELAKSFPINNKNQVFGSDKNGLGNLKPADTPSQASKKQKVASGSESFVDMVRSKNSGSAPIRSQ